MTYKKDNRTQFWVAIYDEPTGGRFIYVAECLKQWFALRFPSLMSVSRAQWERTSNGKDFVFVDSCKIGLLDWDEIDKVMSFAGNQCFWPKIPGYQIDDQSLAYCVAGDYTQCPSDLDRQTDLGRAFHAAKYESVADSEKARHEDYLAGHVIQMIQIFEGCFDPGNAIVSHIPVAGMNPNANLGCRIALRVAEIAHLPLLPCSVVCAKPQFKGLRLDEKFAAWERIYNAGQINISRSDVLDKDVLIVDDLYQSGTSMWAFARFLKNLGARSVIGLACVKSMKDSDNVSG